MRNFRALSLTSRIIIIVALVLVVCLLLAIGTYFYILSKALSRFYETDLVLSSPDGQHELVIREFSCLGGAGAEIYIRQPGQDKWYNRWMEKKVGTTVTDDYFQSFAWGAYYVEWENDHVTLYYCKGLAVENVNDRSTWRGTVEYKFEQ